MPQTQTESWNQPPGLPVSQLVQRQPPLLEIEIMETHNNRLCSTKNKTHRSTWMSTWGRSKVVESAILFSSDLCLRIIPTMVTFSISIQSRCQLPSMFYLQRIKSQLLNKFVKKLLGESIRTSIDISDQITTSRPLRPNSMWMFLPANKK